MSSNARTPAESNRHVYDSASMAKKYLRWGASHGLMDGEKAILARLGNALSGVPLLDIGVGGGRTSPHLSRACRRYVGIDYAEAMVRRCRRSFPHLEFRHCDARDMSAFEAGSFGAAWFSFNGIDNVSPEDRRRILREIARVLSPGGVLVFSTHNLHAPPAPPGLWPKWRQDGHILRRFLSNVRSMGGHLGDLARYRARKARQYRGDGYAMLVDMAHGYRLLMCYVTPEYQVGQLRDLGFGEVEIVVEDGSEWTPATQPADNWLYYVAHKAELVPPPGLRVPSS